MIHGIESNNWNIYCRPDVEAALVKWFLEHSEIRKYAIGDKARKGKKKVSIKKDTFEDEKKIVE